MNNLQLQFIDWLVLLLYVTRCYKSNCCKAGREYKETVVAAAVALIAVLAATERNLEPMFRLN